MDLSKRLKVEVIGPEPPCSRCRSVKENAEKASARIRANGIDVTVEKVNILSEDVIGRYGILLSPALAVNGVVRIMGRVPSDKEIERILAQTS